MGPILIGTSGWTYRDWRGRFYPQKLPQREWLAYYAERFPTVELNVTTYRLPKEHDLARWAAVPPGFVYTVKLSRLITHRKRPGEPRAFVDNFTPALYNTADLAKKTSNVFRAALGADNVIKQEPLMGGEDFSRYAREGIPSFFFFLGTLPPHHRYVVEFRHPSWYDEAVYALLRERGMSLCLHDLRGSIAPLVVTGPVLYVRLHGPVRAYAGSYSRKRLEQWAATILELAPQVEVTFVYFNNDQNAYAPKNALALRKLLGV